MTGFTNIITQPIVAAGLTRTLAAADVTNGNVVDCGRCYLEAVNTGGSTATITIACPITLDGMTIGPRVVSVLAAGVVKIPLSAADYAQPPGATDAGRAHVTYSAASTWNVGVFSL